MDVPPSQRSVNDWVEDDGPAAALPPEFDPNWYRILHPDLVSLNHHELLDHYLKFGRVEGRRANALESRSSFARLAVGQRLLEIGPYFAPLLHGPGVEYADWLSTEGLRSRAVLEGAPSNDIPKIDHVLSDVALGDIPGSFDAILSSHVVEHQPDIIRHFQTVGRLLLQGGRYFVLIPDKRYCFDAWIRGSTIAGALDAYSDRRKLHSLCSVIEHRALTTHNIPAVYWSGEESRPAVDPARVQAALDEFRSKAGAYIDVHAWYFVPESFAELVGLLAKLGLVAFELVRIYPTRRGANEFWAILEKSQTDPC